jgi:hypothetical protein
LNGSLRLWPLWLLVAFAPLVRADDTNPAAKKPAASATSAPAKPAATTAADDELLEFLGSVGEDADGDWIDYLSKTDIPKAAKAKPKTPAAAETTSTSSK